ncbi:RNA 3'-terminal phosphate cyclase [Thiovibrio sp. JS02]
MIEIDGSMGEGGGQVLRTSLALAALLAKPLHIHGIRKHRGVPGLKPQHLAGVKALAAICDARLTGAELGSCELTFAPQAAKAGNYSFAIGSAGSVTLLLQAILPALAFADGPSVVRVSGGTHVPWSPSLHYFAEIFLPMLGRLGVHARVANSHYGFYPKGGGWLELLVAPVRVLAPLARLQPLPPVRITGSSGVARLPVSIAERQKNAALDLLAGQRLTAEIEVSEVAAKSAGTFVFLKAEQGACVGGATALGAKGKPAEAVAREAGVELLSYLGEQACLDPHLADQLIPYLALATGPSQFTTSRVSGHLLTNLRVVERILGCCHQWAGKEGGPGDVRIHGIGFSRQA